MSPPPSLSSSTLTGKSLNPVAEPWIPAKPSTKMDHHPLLPHQFFIPPPPYASAHTYIPFYYHPAGKLLYNHHYDYFALSYPQYQNPTFPRLDGNVNQQQQVVVVVPEKPPHRDVGYGGSDKRKKKKNVLWPTVPPRLLRDGKTKGGLSSNSKNNVCVKWKPKSYSGEKSGGVGIKTRVVSSSSSSSPSSTLPRISRGQNDDPLSENNTTVMIKNIPNKLRRDSLMKFLDRYCNDHNLEYDFIYLPIDFKLLNNLGYAFVNFTTGSAALMIMELLNNYKWGRIKGYQQSKKICEVTWAKIQGKKKLVKHFEESSFGCHTADFLPAEFDPPRNGWSTYTEPKSIGKLKPIGPNYPNHLVGRKCIP